MITNQPEYKKKSMSLKGIYTILIPAFLFAFISIGILALQAHKKRNQLTQAYNQLNEVHTLYAALDNEYEAAKEELDYHIGVSKEMNQLIDLQKSELEAQRKDISKLIGNHTQLDKARSELNDLHAQIKTYLMEIDLLQNEKVSLTDTYKEISAQKAELFSQLSNQLLVNQQLSSARTVLVGQREDLSRKVQIGSVVKVDNIQVKGMKVRSNGIKKEKKASRQVDELKVCFTAMANDLVTPGIETFFVRIVNPMGETLAIEELGSGYLTLNETGENVRITNGTAVKYQNEEQEVCLFWSPNLSFISGTYQIEIYNQGYLSGSESFELK